MLLAIGIGDALAALRYAQDDPCATTVSRNDAEFNEIAKTVTIAPLAYECAEVQGRTTTVGHGSISWALWSIAAVVLLAGFGMTRNKILAAAAGSACFLAAFSVGYFLSGGYFGGLALAATFGTIAVFGSAWFVGRGHLALGVIIASSAALGTALVTWTVVAFLSHEAVALPAALLAATAVGAVTLEGERLLLGSAR